MSVFTWKIRALLTRLDRANSSAWNRIRARKAMARNIPDGFRFYPASRSVGSFETGQQILQGEFSYAGEPVRGKSRSIWTLDSPAPQFTHDIHAFTWLDDLAAIGNKDARDLAQAWVLDWINRYDSGAGPGWTPAATGQRIVRICSHARFLFKGLNPIFAEHIFRSIARQLNYLRRAWRTSNHAQQKLEALAGLVFAGLAFEGRDASLKQANKAIGAEAARVVGAMGDIPTRNPEELMDIFAQLIWVQNVMKEADYSPDARLVAAIERIAPTLRSLRLGDGALARFHGGGRGQQGLLDQLLSDSGVRSNRGGEPAMGYQRVTAASAVLIVDCAPPPVHMYSHHGHASTLAFEFSTGRQPVIVNCGAGQKFGEEWERVCRLTGAHNTLTVADTSSSRIARKSYITQTFGERLLQTPQHVTAEKSTDIEGTRLSTSHDGYVANFGVIHQRRLYLSRNGLEFRGQDRLFAKGTAASTAIDKAKVNGMLLYDIRFHMHPDVDATVAADGKTIQLILPNAEIWSFRSDDQAAVSLEDSVYLDQWQLKPRATKQIVVSGRIMEYAGRTNWIFKRTRAGERNFASLRKEYPTE